MAQLVATCSWSWTALRPRLFLSPAGSQAQTWPRTQTRFLRKVRRSDLPCQDHLLYVGHTMMGRCSLLFTCLLPSFSPVSHHGPIFPSVCLSHTLSHTHMHAHTCTHTHTHRDTHRHTRMHTYTHSQRHTQTHTCTHLSVF